MKDLRKRAEDLIWFFIDYGPTLLTIGFTAFVIARAQTTTIPNETFLQWILAILGLLAISELVERLRKIRHIEEVTVKTLQAVESRLGDRQSADSFFFRRLPQLTPYLEKAHDIRFLGLTLQRTIRENYHVIGQRLSDGAAIKVLVVNPDGTVAQRMHKPDLPLQTNTQLTLRNLAWLNQVPENRGVIEVRLIDEEPYFNIIAIDPEKEYGVIFVEFYPQRWVSAKGRPRIELTPKRDEYWFNYFREQFDKVWNDAQKFDLGSLSEKPMPKV